MSYILSRAGFVVKEQPHPVRLGGETVGDLDVLAVDLKSNTMIAVNCKEWKDDQTAPGARDFNHFLSLMEMENIKHGIVAWTKIPSSVYPLAQNAEKRGYRISIIDKGRYEELHNFMLNGQDDKIEDYFRRSLDLVATTVPTIGQEILLREAPLPRRSVKCSNLLPLHYAFDPPSYVKNAYFKHKEAQLSVKPYLLLKLHAYKEARVPRTGELLDEINREIDVVCDGLTGRAISSDDHVYQVVRDHFFEAYKEHTIQEEDFTVEVLEPKVNRHEMSHKMRVDVARSLPPLRGTYVDAQGISHQRELELSLGDVREISSSFVWVPIWHVTYHLGDYIYVREYFATDSFALRDDMRYCTRCRQAPTVAVCTNCYSTICSLHTLQCKICGQLFCDADSLKCARCQTAYCRTHALGGYCVICGSFMDSTCDVHCAVCNGTVCPVHTVACVECGKPICPPHAIEASYMLAKRYFCSKTCHNKYDSEYRQKGVFGKLGHVIKRS